MMSLDNRPHYSGGCQCGAVRFHVEGALGEASICHCRMCQKAMGNFYAPLVGLREAKLTWTRGEPKLFRSSNFVGRGFCPDCGTPLSFDAPEGLALTIASFDHPEAIVPTVQWGIEAKLPYVDGLAALPGHQTVEDTDTGSYLDGLTSHQHPDHDTDTWPPKEPI